MNTTLLLALFFCHFLADYTWLSTSWMLKAKGLGRPLLPIFAHALTHGALMRIALWVLVPEGDWSLVIALQIGSHFLIDVWKGRMNGWFPALQNPANKLHWVMFGLDQFMHAAVIVWMVHLIC